MLKVGLIMLGIGSALAWWAHRLDAGNIDDQLSSVIPGLGALALILAGLIIVAIKLLDKTL